jgi:hypothetical protein
MKGQTNSKASCKSDRVYHPFAKASTHDNSILDYFVILFLDYERQIGLGLLNFNKMVYSKEGVTRLVLFQR